MFKGLETAYQEAAAIEAEKIAAHGIIPVTLDDYSELVEAGVKLADMVTKGEEIKRFVDKGIIDEIAIEAMKVFGQMDLLKISDADLDRSIAGQKDIIEAATENFLVDGGKKIIAWIKKMFAWIWKQLSKIMKFFKDVAKNKRYPMNPTNMDNFYQDNLDTIKEYKNEINLIPTNDFLRIATGYENLLDKITLKNKQIPGALKINDAIVEAMTTIEDTGNFKAKGSHFDKKSTLQLFKLDIDKSKNSKYVSQYSGWLSVTEVKTIWEKLNKLGSLMGDAKSTIDSETTELEKSGNQAGVDKLKYISAIIQDIIFAFNLMNTEFIRNYKIFRDIASNKDNSDKKKK